MKKFSFSPGNSVASMVIPIVAAAVVVFQNVARADTGASIPWTTYEAENMTISGGSIIGPPAKAVDKNAEVTNTVDAEASGRQCVKLTGAGQYVQFTAQGAANAMVVRYSVPDTADGLGADYTISLYTNGVFSQKLPVTSKYSWIYGYYSFTDKPSDGQARNYYDEVRVPGLSITNGDAVRLQVDAGDSASSYVIDLVDLENVAPPLTAPPGSRSVITYGATGNGITDDSLAISNCVAAGAGVVWVPPGKYLVSRDINVPSGTTVQGAGMWYTTFVGDPAKYSNQYQRVRFNGQGNNIHLADFAIVGRLNIRTDYEANDGLGNAFGTGSAISRIWVEHTKVGAWLYNSSGLIVDGCRFRDTLADGINLNTGMQGTIVTNCTTRGTGDDCFAIWPNPPSYPTPQTYTPGSNVFTHCTAVAPFFANGGGLYGSANNRIEDCQFIDMPCGSGILINGTYPVGTNGFSGQTVVQRCDLIRCGGFDPGWQWRGAFSLDAEDLILTNMNVNHLNITNSLSYAVKILSRNGKTLSASIMSNVNVSGYGYAVPPYHDATPSQADYCDGIYGVWAGNGAVGNLTVSGLVVDGAPVNALPASGTNIANQAVGFAFNFAVSSNAPPQSITGLTVNSGSSISLTYATTPGFTYHLEAATNLGAPVWTTVAGSTTNAAGNSISFTDPSPLAGQRFYRTVSP